MIIPEAAWGEYIEELAKIDRLATERMQKYIDSHQIDSEEAIQQMVGVAYGISTYYGEAAAELAAEMFDLFSDEPAEPADTASYRDINNAVRGALKMAPMAVLVAGAVGRAVKLAGQDTTLKNAIQFKAQVAWIPRGDTCPFCIMLAGEGWKTAYPGMLKDGHARHIHSNCDCAYAIRKTEDTEYAGYDPDKYRKQYDNADGATESEKLNAMRRMYYQQNAEKIRAQKRDSYERTKALNSSVAEETRVD